MAPKPWRLHAWLAAACGGLLGGSSTSPLWLLAPPLTWLLAPPLTWLLAPPLTWLLAPPLTWLLAPPSPGC